MQEIVEDGRMGDRERVEGKSRSGIMLFPIPKYQRSEEEVCSVRPWDRTYHENDPCEMSAE